MCTKHQPARWPTYLDGDGDRVATAELEKYRAPECPIPTHLHHDVYARAVPPTQPETYLWRGSCPDGSVQ